MICLAPKNKFQFLMITSSSSSELSLFFTKTNYKLQDKALRCRFRTHNPSESLNDVLDKIGAVNHKKSVPSKTSSTNLSVVWH